MPERELHASSYAYCRRAVRRSRSNFAVAFRLLPPPARRGMDALYAFMRATDDLTDSPTTSTESVLAVRERLKCWRRSTEAALAGIYTHRLHAALHATVLRFGVPKEYLLEVITGVESDLEPVAFQSFEELYPYCYRVASVVGLACLPIWGCFSPSALRPAESAGIAFQLTNILRDLAEDAARDRYYLPAADWQRFECPPETWPACGENFREMMAEQVSRARRFYEESDALLPYLPRPGLAMFLTMRSTYRSLLEEIATRNYDVYSRRVRVPRWRKAQILAAAWPIKWGWRG